VRRLPLLFTADGMLCFYSLSSLLIWIFRGVSYVTWENQDKVFEKTEVGELKQNGCEGHGYSLWLWSFPLFFRSFTRSTVIIRSSGTTRSTCVNLCDLLNKQSSKSSVLSKTTENSTIFDVRFVLIRFFDNCWPKKTWKRVFFLKIGWDGCYYLYLFHPFHPLLQRVHSRLF